MTIVDRKDKDSIQIAGDYQHKAVKEGFVIQRFWHHIKLYSIKKMLPPLKGEYVFDVGCGSGVVTSYLGEMGAEAVGLDSNEDAIAFATDTYERENIRFILSHADSPIPAEREVDKIYCLELIEHVYMEQAGRMLDEFHGVLRDGGRLFLTTPNYRSAWPLIEALMDRSGLFPVLDEHQHVTHYSKASLRRLAQAHGFEVVQMRTTGFLSPWLSPLGWKLSEWVLDIELEVPFLPGPIIAAVLAKK
jgi:2-polyprenyl-3-methyl-5-hydroxy-6-metoxy-1,4-benzoquinol methylase